MSKFCITLHLEPYLAQWYINENDGEQPLMPKKLSTERRILEVYTIPTPAQAVAEQPMEHLIPVDIAIPHFKCKDPQYYNYLPKPAMNELKHCIRHRFVISLWTDLHRFGYIGKRRDKLVIAWMENHGIEVNDTNFNTILKIYQRQHKNYLERNRRERISQKKKRNQ